MPTYGPWTQPPDFSVALGYERTGYEKDTATETWQGFPNETLPGGAFQSNAERTLANFWIVAAAVPNDADLTDWSGWITGPHVVGVQAAGTGTVLSATWSGSHDVTASGSVDPGSTNSNIRLVTALEADTGFFAGWPILPGGESSPNILAAQGTVEDSLSVSAVLGMDGTYFGFSGPQSWTFDTSAFLTVGSQRYSAISLAIDEALVTGQAGWDDVHHSASYFPAPVVSALIHPPLIRAILDVEPPLRMFPRDDGLVGTSTLRQNASSRQFSPRQHPAGYR